MSDEDGSNEEIKVLNEEDDDSSQRQTSVVSKLTKMSKVKLMLKGLSILPVDDKDDSELELEDREDNVDCWDEEIEGLDDCSELPDSDTGRETSEDDDEVEAETLDDCSELLDS